MLRFWFDRGADGFRVDSAALLIKDPALPVDDPEEHAYTDREEVHQVYRSWRRVADSYSGGRVLIGEVWLPDAERLARYLRPGELHTIFNFPYLECAWDAKALRTVIDDTLRLHRAVHAPATRVLSNHDVDRVVTRYGREDTSFAIYARRHGRPGDLPPGRPAARSTCRSAPAGPARPRCSPRRCPARSTSTRVRNWACGRSRRSPTSCARTRCGSARAATRPTPAGRTARPGRRAPRGHRPLVAGLTPPGTRPVDHVRSRMRRAAAVTVPRQAQPRLSHLVATARACGGGSATDRNRRRRPGGRRPGSGGRVLNQGADTWGTARGGPRV